MTKLPNSRLQRFAWYIAKPISDFLATIKPSSTLAPVLSLLVAVIALIVAIYEIKESRMVRETQLSRWAMEGLADARKMDSGKRATRKENRKDGKERWKCSKGKDQLSARAGQISTLERMARIDPNLRDIVAHDVNLVIDRSRREIKKGLRGINLKNADLSRADLQNTNLRNADLTCVTLMEAELCKSCLKDAILTGSYLIDADLARSDLSGADLSKSDLTCADLYQVNFSRANFKKAILTDADISGADFTRAKGLTQDQLDSACADEDNPPIKLPNDDVSKEPLEWKQNQCKQCAYSFIHARVNANGC